MTRASAQPPEIHRAVSAAMRSHDAFDRADNHHIKGGNHAKRQQGAADNSARHGNRKRRLNKKLPRQLGSTVARRHMADFMRNDRGQFIVIGRNVEKAPIDVNCAAGETE